MPFLRPVSMAKVGLVGLKEDQELIVGVLHDLGVAQLDPVSKDVLTVYGPERASELARTVGDQLIRFRALKGALPRTPVGAPRRFSSLDEILQVGQTVPIDSEVAGLVREADRVTTDRKAVADHLDLLNRFSFYTDRYEYLSAKNVLAFFGEAKPEAYQRLQQTVPQLGAAQFLASEGPDLVRFVVVVRAGEGEAASRLAQQNGVRLIAVPRWTGTRAEILPWLKEQEAALDRRAAEIQERLTAIAREWYATVVSVEEALAIENRKLEVYTKFAASERTFTLEAWVRKKDRAMFERAVVDATHGRAFVFDIPTSEEPPTVLDNKRAIKWYEFFIRFYSIPEATEWDPTLIFAISFTIFFGIMLGDVGFALVILAVCIWMIRGFPGARYLPKGPKNFVKLIMTPSGMRQLAYTLLPGLVVALALGVVFDQFFGFPLFSYLIPSYHGVQLINKTTIAQLLKLAGYIGVFMVCLGFFLGAIREYFLHHWGGFAAKSGGILFAIGIAWIGLTLLEKGQVQGGFGAINPILTPILAVPYALLVGGLAMMFLGEGIQVGAIGLIEVVSHILSFVRLIGILLASVVLAVVIDSIAVNLASSGAVGLILAAAILLVVGLGFCVILGVFEPGIQGARLIFVEHFSKYYQGGGKPFQVFGTRRTYTEAHYASSAGAPPPPPASSTP